MTSKPNSRLAVFGSLKTKEGPILTVLDIRPHENKTVIDNLQKVVSAYAKNVDRRWETAKAFLEQSEIMYAYEKRATRLLNVARPMALKQSGYMGNIIRSKKSVKLKGVPFSDVFEEKKMAHSPSVLQ